MSEHSQFFAIRRVDRNQFQLLEQLGSKRKFWFIEDERRFLFKAEDRKTGDDWAEVVACHLCGLLGIPHVQYELAMECVGDKQLGPGAVCENMAPHPLQLFLGNVLLLARDPRYPAEPRSKFKVSQHEVQAVCDVVGKLRPPDAVWLADVPDGIESALDFFVGYVMFDAWIANTDRHHENWAAIGDGNALRLAPTFDHGAALARNLQDTEREERLTTKDRNRTIEAFAQKGRSAFFGSVDSPRPLELRDAFEAFGRYAPKAATSWLERLRSLNRDTIHGIVESVPDSRLSDIGKQFTIQLLRVNQGRLLRLA